MRIGRVDLPVVRVPVPDQRNEEGRAMDCLSDIAPSEEDLIAFALDDQPLPAAEQEHLAHCERCQRRLEELRSATALLVARLYRSQCPDALSLSYYSAGGLSDERRIA